MDKHQCTRRSFISKSLLTAATVSIVPSHVLGKSHTAPSDRVRVAGIGISGMGKRNLEQLAPIADIVALCDVDFERAAPIFKTYPKAKIYNDFRKMLDKEPSIDAVVIATPDHTHAVIAMAAMKRGKHVYCQKPLTHTVEEAQKLAGAAKEYGVVTQMGNQGHAREGAFLLNEWIAAGAIGEVQKVHCWTNRPIWPQGVEAPQEIVSVPPTFDWDLWQGPAEWRPYHPALTHFVWRGWKDYGVGALGDMGAHIIDHPYWALNLGYPERVQATSTDLFDASYPNACVVKYQFAAKNGRGPVDLWWYDGGLKPMRPECMEPGRRLGGSGILYQGTKGVMMQESHGGVPRIVPETKMREFEVPEKTLKRSPGIHEEWIEAIVNGGQSSTDFSYSGPLTETMLLGNIAILTSDQNTVLEWDDRARRFTNLKAANALLSKEYRKGWSLEDM
ncbi:MAG: Gfo/Idh/MocA family oxidoreductase [candidate division KSB1 bacterium]|nr:Gfo/Idh/MocA family oxidoreductase [candidate division KSB1 bacterium]